MLNTWELMNYERAADKYEALPTRDTTLENRSRFDVCQREADKRRGELKDRYLRECASKDYAAYKAKVDAISPDAIAGECKVDAAAFKKLLKAVKKIATTKKQRRDTLNHHNCFDDLLDTVKLVISPDGMTAKVNTIGETRFITETADYAAPVSDAKTFHIIVNFKTLNELVHLLPDGTVTLQYRWMINRLVLRYPGGRATLPITQWIC